MGNLTGSVAGNISLTGGGSGTDDYNDLSNKPSINSVTLTGNKTSSDLNINYNSLPDQPSINGVTLIGDKTSADLNISSSNDYEDLNNKPSVNGVPLIGNKTTADLNINIISDYDDLSDKPSINGVTLTGNKTTADLNINVISDYDDLSDRPSINGVTLTGNKTTSDLNINIITDYDDLTDKPSINNVTLSGNKTTADLNIASADITYDNTTSGLSSSNVQSAIDELDTSIDTNTSDITSIKGIYDEVSASGAIASFTGLAALPITSGKFYINAIQEGSGTPSPDNVRPITGFSSMDITRCGKNLRSGKIENSYIRPSGYIGTSDAYIMAYGQVKAGVTYVITTDDDQFVGGFFTSVPEIGSTTYGERVVQASKSFVAPIDGYVAFRCYTGYASPQLELGTTATTYEAYQGTTQTISFGTTNYGGYYDSVTGKLVNTHGNIESYNGETLTGAWLSSMDEYVEGTTPTIGAQVVYELASPTETDIQTTCISTLEGTNNIYHNCNGNTEVTAFKQNTIIPGLEKVLKAITKYL